MRFVKPVDLWDQSIIELIEAGCLRLQRGQWITCGKDADHLSRLHEIRRRGDGSISYIRAFHGPNAADKFAAYMNSPRIYRKAA